MDTTPDPTPAAVAQLAFRLATATDTADTAQQLATIAELETLLTRLRERTVAQAVVVDGWTWPRVGAALGITRQGALKRYDRAVWDYSRARTRALRDVPFADRPART